MARINPVKTKQEAEKLEKAGRLEQAIALYRQITDDNPLDWNTVNKVGDLYAKLNRNREAGAEYAKVADYYAKDGFLLKAIAIWKKINKLDATALEPYVNLAELYAKQGLMMEAKAQYQTIVDEYVRRGRLRDAGEILRRMADIDPGDLKIRSKLADLYTREGNSARAVEEHIAIADELNKKGHLAEALQVLEKGLKLGPQNPRLRAELARIHLLQKNYDKAVHFLEEAIQGSPNDVPLLSRLGEAYLGAKKIEEAQAIFRRLIELNPSDQEARVQMGRLYLVQGQFDQAFDELLCVVERLLEQREGDRAVALLQQIIQRNPNHIKSLVKLAEVYRAIGKDGLIPTTYSQLTEAYIKEGRLDQAAGILEALMTLEPQNQQHRTKLAFVRERLATGRAPARPTAAAPAKSSFEIEEEEEFDLDQPVPFGTTMLHAPRPAAAAPPARAAAPGPKTPVPRLAAPAIEVSGPLSAEDREFLDEHMAEGRVFRKYGLTDKALDQFEAIVARFPDQIEARRELLDLYKEKGPPDKALEHCLALAEAYRMKGDAGAAEACRADAKSLLAGTPPPPALPAIGAPTGARRAPTVAPAPPAVETHEEIPIDVEELGFAEAPGAQQESVLAGLDLGQEEEALPSRFLEMEEAAPGSDSEEFDLSAPGGLEPLPTPPAFGVRSRAEELDLALPVEEELEIPLPVPEPPARRQPVAPPPSPAADEDLLGAFGDFPEPPPPVPTKPRPARAPSPPPAPARASTFAAPAAPSSLAPDLARALANVDQSLAFGFVDEAKEALRNVGARYPSHPAILEKIEQFGLDADSAEQALEESPVDLSSLAAPAAAPLDAFGELGLPESGPAAASAAFPESAPFDLGSEIDDLFGAQTAVQESRTEAAGAELGDPGLVQIFEEFRKGVDQQLGNEDYDTRYNLGIAYKEMGLIDEAVAEFQLAAKDPQRLLECSSMLGLCFLEKGMAKLAVKWFEKGLKAPGRLPEEYNGLRYDLATAHDAAGEPDAALSVYSDLYGHDASFRDVAAKVRELKARRGR